MVGVRARQRGGLPALAVRVQASLAQEQLREQRLGRLAALHRLGQGLRVLRVAAVELGQRGQTDLPGARAGGVGGRSARSGLGRWAQAARKVMAKSGGAAALCGEG